MRFNVAILSLGFLSILWFVIRRSRNHVSKLCLDDLLIGDDDKLSKAAVVMLGAYAITTWLIVDLELHDKMTEGYLTIYVAAWIAPTVTRLVVNRPGGTQ